MIDGPMLMILAGAAIQGIPPACRLIVHIRRRPRAAPALGSPART
ncbi:MULTISPECIES: hypothetical protein [Sphingomonas]|nr:MULTISPECIES: hypothetical protein [Sphingomonas]